MGKHTAPSWGADLHDGGLLREFGPKELVALAEKLTAAAQACQYEAGRRGAGQERGIYNAVGMEAYSAFQDVLDELASARDRLGYEAAR